MEFDGTPISRRVDDSRDLTRRQELRRWLRRALMGRERVIRFEI